MTIFPLKTFYLPAALVARLWQEALAVGMLLPATLSKQLSPLETEPLVWPLLAALQACRTFTAVRLFCTVTLYLWASLSICRIFTFLALGNLLLSQFCDFSLPPSTTFKIFVETAKMRPAWDSSTYWNWLQQNAGGSSLRGLVNMTS